MDSLPAFGAAETPIEVLERDPAVIYILDRTLHIVYCNRAWDDFAMANGGESIVRNKVLGRSVLDFIHAPLGGFYRSVFESALMERRIWDHTYECSSPSLLRRYRMQALPLGVGNYLLVINSLVVEHPHDSAASDPLPELYRDSNGMIAMCSHCRRTRRAAAPEVWDWVPAFISPIPERVSHALCPTCVAYHYPGLANR